jgi:4-amino-4-deoxy-L-arabinose transferase-like glycosyltransferase
MTVMLIACAALIGKELVKLARKQPITWKTVNLLVEVKALVILGILLGTYFLSKYTGMFVIGAVFCALGFLVFFRCKKWSYYAITLGLAVGIWCAFRFGLGVSF